MPESLEEINLQVWDGFGRVVPVCYLYTPSEWASAGGARVPGFALLLTRSAALGASAHKLSSASAPLHPKHIHLVIFVRGNRLHVEDFTSDYYGDGYREDDCTLIRGSAVVVHSDFTLNPEMVSGIPEWALFTGIELSDASRALAQFVAALGRSVSYRRRDGLLPRNLL